MSASCYAGPCRAAINNYPLDVANDSMSHCQQLSSDQDGLQHFHSADDVAVQCSAFYIGLKMAICGK